MLSEIIERVKCGKFRYPEVEPQQSSEMDNESRSISSAMPIPNWMKTKRNNRFDLDQGAFSPTEMDDVFFYMKSAKEPSTTTATQNQSNTLGTHDIMKDISKHPLPCQKYIQNPQIAGAQEVVITSSTSKLKSCGVDDGFKGEAAKCGSSIIRVAHQMVSGQFKGLSSSKEQNDDSPATSVGFNPSRRGSKSLPASPVMSPNASPKVKRRHKYFTGPFVCSNPGKEGGVLATLLGRRDISTSLDVIAEKDVENVKHVVSIASINENQSPVQSNTPVYTPQPSELREMNFWSPTSM